MIEFLPSVDAMLDWLVRTSWQIAALVLIVLVVQRLVGRWLQPRWRYALWVLVLLRLMIPGIPEVPGALIPWDQTRFDLNAALPEFGSEASLPMAPATPARSLAGASPIPRIPRELAAKAAGSVDSTGVSNATGSADSNRSAGSLAAAEVQDRQPSESAHTLPSKTDAELEVVPQEPARPASVPVLKVERLDLETDRRSPASATESTGIAWPFWIVSVWATIALALLIRMLGREWLFRRRLAKESSIDDARTLALLDECRRSLGIRRPVQLLRSNLVASPAITGWLRPRLLLPEVSQRELEEPELRLVFLHELAHLRKADVALNGLLATLQCVYWFHPLVRFAIARLRSAQESVRDWDALAAAPGTAPRQYAATLLKLVENHSGRGYPAVGFLHSRHDVKRRILMITHFSRQTRRNGLLGLASVFVIGWATLTSVAAEPVDWNAELQARSVSKQQEIQVEARNEQPAWKRELQAQMGQTVSLSFDDATFDQIVDYLRSETGLNMIIHPDVDTGWEVDMNVEDMRLDHVLGMLCHKTGDVNYGLVHGAIYFAYEDYQVRDYELRFYKIQPLLKHSANRDFEDDLLDGLVSLIYDQTDSAFDYDGAYLQYWNGLLSISQTKEVHEQVHNLMNQLLNRGTGEPTTAPEWESKLVAALNQRASVDFKDASITEAVHVLSEEFKIPIVLDPDADDYDIWLQLNDLPLGEILGWVARFQGVRISLKDGAVHLGYRYETERRVYDVSDVVYRFTEDNDDEWDARDYNRDHLESLIRDTIRSESWDEDGCMITFWGDLMIVNNSAEIHGEIDSLLATLRRALK